MGQCVVISAEECQIAGPGLSPVDPVLDVMGVAPAWIAIAPRPGAVSVSGNESPSRGGGDDPGASADVDDLAVRPEHDTA